MQVTGSIPGHEQGTEGDRLPPLMGSAAAGGQSVSLNWSKLRGGDYLSITIIKFKRLCWEVGVTTDCLTVTFRS